MLVVSVVKITDDKPPYNNCEWSKDTTCFFSQTDLIDCDIADNCVVVLGTKIFNSRLLFGYEISENIF